MSPKRFQEMFAPRRLRDSMAQSRSAEGRLARQLRSLSAYAQMRQLRRYSTLSRRRRLIVAVARIAVAAIIVLAVSGIAAATAGYVARQVWPSIAAVERVDRVDRSLGLPKTRIRGKALRQPQAKESPAQLLESKGDVPVAAARTPPASSEVAAMPPRRAQTVAANHVSTVAPARQRPLETDPATLKTVRPQAAPLGGIANGGFAMEPPPSVSPPSGPLPKPFLAEEPAPVKTAPESEGRVSVRADAVTQEAALLRRALAALRREHDARGALRLLDDYDWRFGHGALALEASSARAQALLQLGDNSHALDLLDRLPLSEHGNGGELRVTRGELRSLSGRCREALLDFDAVLGAPQGIAPSEVARALFGRASCRARGGDTAGAEEDRQRYLRDFPQGPAARRLLSQP